MTDSAQPTGTPTPPPVPQASENPRKRWMRRIVRIAIVLVVLLLAFRAAVSIALPMVLQRVASFYGADCDYQRSQLSFLGGDAEIWQLKFTPKDGSEPFIHADYVRGDLSPLNRLRGRLVVWRVEADGVNLLVDINDQGQIALLKHFAGEAVTASLTKETPSGGTRSIDLTSPLRLDAFRL